MQLEKLAILLTISEGKKRHYIFVKRLSALLGVITSRNNGAIYCLNCFHSLQTKSKLESHGKVCKYYDHSDVKMPKENDKILNYVQGQKSTKTPFIIYKDTDFLRRKIYVCQDDPENFSTVKVSQQNASGYSIFTECAFDNIKNKHDHYKGKDCMKKFCKDLKERPMKKYSYRKKR